MSLLLKVNLEQVATQLAMALRSKDSGHRIEHPRVLSLEIKIQKMDDRYI